MKRFLICNADDFGIGRRITDAIVDCHVNGIISNTTLMANMPAAEYACKRAKELPSLGVGVHLTLTEGRPLSPAERVSDLIDEQGQFLPVAIQRRQLWQGRKILEQVQYEFTAQIERTFELGITPTHSDSHHAIHKMPIARKAMIKVLQKFNIFRARRSGGYYWTARGAAMSLRLRRVYLNCPMTLRTVMHFWNQFLIHRAGIQTPNQKINREMLIPTLKDPKQRLLACLANLPTGVSEMVFHPGYPDPEVKDPESFAAIRQIDTVLAADLDILAAIKKHDINLISYRDI